MLPDASACVRGMYVAARGKVALFRYTFGCILVSSNVNTVKTSWNVVESNATEAGRAVLLGPFEFGAFTGKL
jgi:hypothetical protein